MRVTVCVCWAFVMAMFIPQANAIVPLTTPIQGVLRDGAGVPVADAHFGMTFTLYTGAGAEAEAVWSEAWPPGGGNCLVDHTGCIHVTGGRFRIRLGLLNPLEPEVFSVGPLWLGIQVESEPELPRRPLGTSPYAYQAAVAGGLDCTGCVDLEALSGEAQSALIDETLAAVAAEGYATGDEVQGLAQSLADVAGTVEALAPIGE
ncbi:MAG: hypothetical protein VYE15_06290, partial [Myxococcota bacterium]|nr:hypothetical protein [Myxococcota bacterium]